MRNKKKLVTFLASVLSLALLVGTWAFFNATSSIDNKLKTNSYGNRTVEEFTPEQEIEPGMEIDKVVGNTNTGDYDLVVRIKMSEVWARNDVVFISHESADADFNTITRGGISPDYTYSAEQYDFEGTNTASSDGIVDNGINADESVMYKTLDLTNWTDGGDGYWYYNNLLKPGQSTGALMTSVVLADNADMGKYNSGTFYSTVAKDDSALLAAQGLYDAAAAAYLADPTAGNKADMDEALEDLNEQYGWTDDVESLDESTITFIKAEDEISAAGGYANANYTLTVTTEVCQATKEAVDATWGSVPSSSDIDWGW